LTCQQRLNYLANPVRVGVRLNALQWLAVDAKVAQQCARAPGVFGDDTVCAL
jgi:hypothetical protein